jgi:hypothetical protein
MRVIKQNLLFTGFLFILLFVLQGYSESDSGSNSDGSQTSEFSPPSWIQGAWTSSDSFGDSGWKFTASDVYMIAVNTVGVGAKEIEKLDPSSGSTSTVSSSDTEFSFAMPASCTSVKNSEPVKGSLTFKFEKVDENTIKQTGSSNLDCLFVETTVLSTNNSY